MTSNPQQDEIAPEALDFHYTIGDGTDTNPVLRWFQSFCALISQGSTLLTIEKRFAPNGDYNGYVETRIQLPEQFNGMWCRFFYRDGEPLILVMDYDKQDFIIYDFNTCHRRGRWLLPQALPEDSFLTRIEVNPDNDDQFSIFYSHFDEEYSIEWSFNAPLWASEMISVH